MAAAAAAIDGVAVALEIIDSRYAGFEFRLPDVVADNTSAAAFVVGDWVDPATAGDLTPSGASSPATAASCTAQPAQPSSDIRYAH